MNTSTSLFAKALATENIFVSFESNAPTASFDVESRTLTIPDWKISDTLRDMVVAHEVAHALFTPPEHLVGAMNAAKERNLNKDGYKACLNVIEDARIERLIKEKFPGCRRDFYSGYKEIIDTDLFALKQIDPATYTIVDKINLHFKFGLFGLMHFEFNELERRLMDRIANVQTFEEVVRIADELYAVAAEQEKKKTNGSSMFGQGNAAQDLTEAMQKIERDGSEDEAQKGEQRVEDFPHLSYPLPRCDSSKTIIPYSVLIPECRHAEALFVKNFNGESYITLCAKYLEEYRKESQATVQALVAQFERRKAAEEYRKERHKPTGVINPDRLHQFKTHDDIFLRNLIKHEGKKHGMVMLIDWSGSMDDCVEAVVRQVLLLSWFCRKAKIPYEVFLYTEDRHEYHAPENKSRNRNVDSHVAYSENMRAKFGQFAYDRASKDANRLGLSDVALRQVLSSTQTDAEAQQMEQFLWNKANRYYNEDPVGRFYNSCCAMNMHGTPSCEALMAMHDFLPKYREAMGLQVVDFIFITDGEPTGLSREGNKAYLPVKSVRVQHLPTGRVLSVPAMTKARYGMGQVENLNVAVQYFLADEIRKLGVVTVGFSIGGLSGLHTNLVKRFISEKYHGETVVDHKAYEAATQDLVKRYNEFYRKENMVIANPNRTPGFDEYYIIRPVKPMTEDDMEKMNTTNSTITKIRNTFLKSMQKRKCSRVFLTRFIDLISGRKIMKFTLPS
jgi:hypothetical protein